MSASRDRPRLLVSTERLEAWEGAMKGFTFLDERADDENMMLLGISRAAIVHGAVNAGLIVDDDLAMVPEIGPMHISVASSLRDDLYKHHSEIKKQIQFPLVQNCCCYAFAKGAESAYLWHSSPKGQVRFAYSKADALRGAAGADVPDDFAKHITAGMNLGAEVFCDFQDRVLLDPNLGFAQGGRWLADCFACAFFWFTQVGVDFGMAKLGYP
jgi:hypothetical protein